MGAEMLFLLKMAVYLSTPPDLLSRLDRGTGTGGTREEKEGGIKLPQIFHVDSVEKSKAGMGTKRRFPQSYAYQEYPLGT
jgi:hypothetical protein